MPFYVLPHDHKEPIRPIDLPEESSEFLRVCRDTIGCDLIEIANTIYPDIVLIVDESGLLKDGWEKRINPRASYLYSYYSQPIVGTAIIARRSGADLVPLTFFDAKIIFGKVPR